ncbi:hypothetical protein ACFYPN_08950 [Streptomyces sp. NPDC005576]|uniref:hypothetical protein n=1 Tax=unclassified Streptomyces TaxID=2593676 RepID=UPI0033CB87EF
MRTSDPSAADRVNAKIRHLMDEDHDQDLRAAEYERLLVQWADVTRAGALTVAA